MPNGGIPRHMIMKPRYHNPHVIHCEGAVFRIYAADEWSKAFEA
jgi:hypothetical protein